jgi:hypothetical protein
MAAAWIGLSFIFFVFFSALFVPALGLGGLFYSWLAANIAVAFTGFLLALKNDA